MLFDSKFSTFLMGGARADKLLPVIDEAGAKKVAARIT